jgi:hypothetical protein
MNCMKMSWQQVSEARRRYIAGERMRDIALDLGFNFTTVQRAIRGIAKYRRGRKYPRNKDFNKIPPVPFAIRQNSRRKLTVSQVRDARRRHARGEQIAKLAKEAGVVRSCMRNAVRRYTFKWIE